MKNACPSCAWRSINQFKTIFGGVPIFRSSTKLSRSPGDRLPNTTYCRISKQTCCHHCSSPEAGALQAGRVLSLHHRVGESCWAQLVPLGSKNVHGVLGRSGSVVGINKLTLVLAFENSKSEQGPTLAQKTLRWEIEKLTPLGGIWRLSPSLENNTGITLYKLEATDFCL